MKSYEKDLIYQLISRDNYLEKACRVFCDAYSPEIALDNMVNYLKHEVESVFRGSMSDCSTNMFMFYLHLMDSFNYREMAIFILDFYR
jgi:hypothetical protein